MPSDPPALPLPGESDHLCLLADVPAQAYCALPAQAHDTRRTAKYKQFIIGFFMRCLRLINTDS